MVRLSLYRFLTVLKAFLRHSYNSILFITVQMYVGLLFKCDIYYSDVTIDREHQRYLQEP
jgi:hypothetical protein